MTAISVITINKGRDAHLARLLEGLGRGTSPDECIVVAMGSDAPARHDGIVRTVPLAVEGLPLALARNTGRAHAGGDVLVFLDVDSIPSADLVASLASAVRAHGGLVCCEILYLPEGAVADGWTEATLGAAGRRHPARRFPSTGVAPAPTPGLFWSLAFAIEAARFDRLGGFDTRFSGYGAEDTDFAFRAAEQGLPILFSAAGRAYHQRHQAYDPPLQHCADIVGNATLFRHKHGFWPMGDWLDAFARMGLIVMDANSIAVLRDPTAAEMEAARVPPDRPF